LTRAQFTRARIRKPSGGTAPSFAGATLTGAFFTGAVLDQVSFSGATLGGVTNSLEREGGQCAFVASAGEVYDTARRTAQECGGHYLDQFTNAERATDWRGNNNIAESIFQQLADEPHPVPEWVVVGAGTGGTSATIGRYLRYRGLTTRLAVVDPEGSAFLPAYAGNTIDTPGSRMKASGDHESSPPSSPASSTA
jgi:cysteine synthase A